MKLHELYKIQDASTKNSSCLRPNIHRQHFRLLYVQVVEATGMPKRTDAVGSIRGDPGRMRTKTMKATYGKMSSCTSRCALQTMYMLWWRDFRLHRDAVNLGWLVIEMMSWLFCWRSWTYNCGSTLLTNTYSLLSFGCILRKRTFINYIPHWTLTQRTQQRMRRMMMPNQPESEVQGKSWNAQKQIRLVGWLARGR